MMFNRFLVEPVDNFVVLHFGLLNAAGFVLDRYSCALFREDLEMQKQSLIAYLGQLGSLRDRPPVWLPPQAMVQIDVANQIGTSSNADSAETTFNNLVVRTVIEARLGHGGVVTGEPVALLRSTQEAQKHLIRELYHIK
jgi:hypothetical protein